MKAKVGKKRFTVNPKGITVNPSKKSLYVRHMLSKEYILQFLKDNKSKIEKEFGVQRIGLFGSYASGCAVGQSDVDILVSFNKNTNGLHEKKRH